MIRFPRPPARRASARVAVAALALPLAVAACQSPSVAAGPSLASLTADCARCHGPTGFTRDGALRPLAGRPEADLAAALAAIRAGTTQHPPMAVAASAWTDETITALARYYSRIR